METNQFLAATKKYFNTDDFIPLHRPVFLGNEKQYVTDTIDSTFVSSVGEYVNKVEEFIANYTSSAKATAVVNGTAAIQVALRLVGVEAEDEVLTQALTFVATANAISYNHATPVFIDVDRDTMGMSPNSLLEFLEEFAERREGGSYNKKTGKRIAACLPMHTFGFICRMDEIVKICKDWGIPVVEDAAEALGSFSNGRSAGTFGAVGTFSFNGNKIVTAGGGGALISQDAQLMDKAKYLTTTAKVPHAYEYFHDVLGYNYRMPNLNAALLLAQLEGLDKFKLEKKALFEFYQEQANKYGFRVKTIPTTTSEWNYWLISLEFAHKSERDSFLKAANDNGVMSRPIWQLMHKLPMYQACQKDEQVNSTYLEDRIVNIPSSVRV